ncbi:c-type cytochrome [Hyphococcus formosus]|uniref:c-type cytochrome n=1 Tax=Hyphococcus formosus TaxID=3143534 RepID=UPI00398A7D84
MKLLHTMLIAAALSISACDYSPKSSLGFRLPDGNAEKGQQIFAQYQCASCHVIPGRDDLKIDSEPKMSVVIGGMTTQVKTYGQLVTSVINPSHRISRYYRSEEYSDDGVSKMRNYNDVMTVSELIDLVTFLQSQYEEMPNY